MSTSTLAELNKRHCDYLVHVTAPYRSQAETPAGFKPFWRREAEQHMTRVERRLSVLHHRAGKFTDGRRNPWAKQG